MTDDLYHVGGVMVEGLTEANASLPSCPLCGATAVTDWINVTTGADWPRARYVPGLLRCPVCG